MASKSTNVGGVGGSGGSSGLGAALWNKQDKCNAEFFALTYGSLVAELIRDLERPQMITNELDRMGHSMGVRCIEEVLAKLAPNNARSNARNSFSESADLVVTAFFMFFGIAVESKALSDNSYSVSFADNPLAIFVEMPAATAESSSGDDTEREKLEYSQLLAGMIRGMLEMLQYDTTCKVVGTVLNGDDTNTVSVELKQILQEGAGEDYQEE